MGTFKNTTFVNSVTAASTAVLTLAQKMVSTLHWKVTFVGACSSVTELLFELVPFPGSFDGGEAVEMGVEGEVEVTVREVVGVPPVEMASLLLVID